MRSGQFLSKDIQACEASRAEDKDQILSKIADIQDETPRVQPIKVKALSDYMMASAKIKAHDESEQWHTLSSLFAF